MKSGFDEFDDEFVAQMCEANNQCLTAAGRETLDCDATTDDGENQITCDYSPSIAADCLDAIGQEPCNAGLSRIPDVCRDVYTNCREGQTL